MRACVFFTAALLLAQLAQAEPALTVRATDLLAQAQSDAAKVASLPENTKVDVLKRVGAWNEVKTAANQTGWVRMTALKIDAEAAGATAGRNAPGVGGQLAGLLSSGRSGNTATVTTGVRGLQEEDLQMAQANPAEFKKMQKYAVGKDAADAFAQRSQLTPAKLDYLQQRAPATTNSSGGAPGMPGA